MNTESKDAKTAPVPSAPIFPVKGADLVAGMQTYIRVVSNGKVTFRKDCYLQRKIENTGACRNGVHFMVPSARRNTPRLVCYWQGATVFVRVIEEAERAEAEAGDDSEVFHNLPDKAELMPVRGSKRKASK